MYLSLRNVPTYYSFTNVNETLNLLTDFRKILKYLISLKSAQWEPICTMRTDGRTDMRKLVVALCNFEKVPKNVHITLQNVILWTYDLTMFCVCVCVCVCVRVLRHVSVLRQLNMGSKNGANDAT